MSYVNKLNTIIDRLDNADFDNIVYDHIFVSTPINVIVNGFDLGTVSITDEPINIVVKTVTSADPTSVYLLGTRIDWYRDELVAPPIIAEAITTEGSVDLLTESGVELTEE